MTTQEEIGEGVADLIFDIAECGTGKAGYCRTRILSYLHSQGVVIKVDRELPKSPYPRISIKSPTYAQHHRNEWQSAYSKALADMLKAGYVAVEPLIREEEE